MYLVGERLCPLGSLNLQAIHSGGTFCLFLIALSSVHHLWIETDNETLKNVDSL